jgi:hypothetical protein
MAAVSFSYGWELEERNCYAFGGATAAALGEDPTLGEVVDRAVLTRKKYIPPKHPGTGEIGL